MINFTSRTSYYISFPPTDMRKGRETLADIVRNSMCLDPHEYNNTYITIIFKRIMSLL